MISLVILYEPEDGESPVPICRVENEKLALLVAQAAVASAEQLAADVADADAGCGQIALAEAERLKVIFSGILPGFRMSQTTKISQMTPHNVTQ